MDHGPKMEPAERPAATDDPLIGRVFNDKFKIVAPIARGGMGVVYRAEQAPLGRACAIKVLTPRIAEEQRGDFQRRFFLEASVASKLTHPNAVTIFDYGRTEDDLLFMAMELLEGQPLSRAIREGGPISEARAVHIGRQISRALREAHALGVVHRDIKSANVFLVRGQEGEDDFIKVLDFGLVKEIGDRGNVAEDLTESGALLGSPKYMAPEQIRGEHTDARTDIYALGVVLYELATGRVPFERSSTIATLMAHVSEPPPPFVQANASVHLSPAFEQLVMRCLAKAPDDRFEHIDALLAALKQLGDPALAALTMTGAHLSTSPNLIGSVSESHVFIAGATGPQPSVLDAPDAPAPSQPPARSKGRMAAAGVGVLCLLLAGIFVRQQMSAHDEVTTAAHGPAAVASEPQPTAPVSSPAQAAPTPTAAAPVTLSLTSVPSGAAVHVGNANGRELCTATPCSAELLADESAKQDALTLHFSKPGYLPISKQLASGETRISASLMKFERAVPRKKTPQGGYRNDPYANPPY